MSVLRCDRKGLFVEVSGEIYRPGKIAAHEYDSDGEARNFGVPEGWRIGDKVIAVSLGTDPLARVRKGGDTVYWGENDVRRRVSTPWMFHTGQKYKQRNGKLVTVTRLPRKDEDDCVASASNGSTWDVYGRHRGSDTESGQDLVELIALAS